MDLVLKEATIITGGGRYPADVGVFDGRIAAITRPRQLSGRAILDCQRLFVLPGAIDAHVHFRDPGFPEKEDFASGSEAAAVGVLTMLIDMPNTNPPVKSASILKAKVESFHGRAYVDHALYAVVTPDNIDAAPALIEGGAVGLKGYLGLSTSGLRVLDDGSLLEVLELGAKLGFLLTVHAEDQALLELAKRRIQGEGGAVAWTMHSEARPAAAEIEAVRRASAYATVTGGRLHIAHLTTEGGVEAVREARRQGARVTAEASPFHLLLCTDDAERLGPRGVTNPPLRAASDRQALWKAALDGTIDIVATDHAPHTREEKLRNCVWQVKSGNPGTQTMLPLLLHQASQGRLRLEDVARLCSERVADVFGLAPRKGRIQVGSDADLTVVDMDRTLVISQEWLRHKVRLTPFEGWQVTGVPVYTIVRGEVVMAEGKIVGGPIGQYIAPGRS
jgi:dihydroorotase